MRDSRTPSALAPATASGPEPDLDDATRPRRDPAHAGRYRLRLTPDWNAPIFPQGGVVSAIALRAMAEELQQPAHILHSSTTLFVSKVDNGDIEVDVEVLRAGRRMSHCMATVRNPSSAEPGHRVLAVFGEPRDDEHFEFTALEAPAAPPPRECEEPPERPDGLRPWPTGFFDRTEVRRVRHHQSWETGWEGGRAEAIRWMRMRRPPRDPEGMLPLWTLLALSDTMPSAVGQWAGPGAPPFLAPSVDLAMHYFDRVTSGEWLLSRICCRRAHSGYASAENELWSEDGRLVAWATQTMLLRMHVQPPA